ncbi:dihydrofolate reductase family protein [Algoriphagus litoralis]|uniref:dihydrofolate reductase family protein n=1 Tax=Algoriphagus litoralis TaxID=2202829 RepID=UPI000DBA7F4E|nr:dihydrofolate reductase family protein [Algoriphagus litoralis]
MRRLIVMSFISLDGVIQSPGAPEEDTDGGFNLGGWVAPYHDAVSDKIMERLLKPADLLLGRKTFEIWENYWPAHAAHWPRINEVTKYTLSRTRNSSDWSNTVFLDSVSDIEKIKSTAGGEIHVWGSSEVVQLLLKHGLVDEFWLMIHPVLLGQGKKLFNAESTPVAFTLMESITSPSGVIYANYHRAGEVNTGTIGS